MGVGLRQLGPIVNEADVLQVLPEDVQRLCCKLHAPSRLVAHLTLVHSAAVEIVNQVKSKLPKISFDAEAVLFGAATHDLGKVSHPSELTGPGSQHENDGPALLEHQGVPPHLARFARTHGTWDREPVEFEDLLVALADTVWKGKRLDTLENMTVRRITETTGQDTWEVFAILDEILTTVAEKGDERLEWQREHS